MPDKPFVIDDSTPNDVLFPDPQIHGRGLDLSLRTAEGYGDSAEPFPAALLIPESEWEPRIRELEERGATQEQRARTAGHTCKDQGRTNYCWINSPTDCLEYLRVVQNEPRVVLSPASGGAVIKNGRNVGGWGREAIEFIANTGLVPVDLWPANAIDLSYQNRPGVREARQKYRFDGGWWVLRSIEEEVSAILRGLPASGGYNWWAHQVTTVGFAWIGGRERVRKRIRNSWGRSWGEDGYGWLEGQRMYADDLVVPKMALPA